MKKETAEKLKQALLLIGKVLNKLDKALYFNRADETHNANRAIIQAVEALEDELKEPTPQPEPPKPA